MIAQASGLYSEIRDHPLWEVFLPPPPFPPSPTPTPTPKALVLPLISSESTGLCTYKPYDAPSNTLGALIMNLGIFLSIVFPPRDT